MRVRLVAACVALALSVTVPLQPLLAEAQSKAAKRNTDGYDVGAAIMTVVGAPLKGAVCLIGGVAGGTLFLATFGYADRQAAAVVREGCDQRWVVRGDDIRPDPEYSSRALLLDPDPQAGQR
jgi:hypothetical protein